MLVPAMTIEEVHNELQKDLPCVLRKGVAEASLFEKEIRRKKLNQRKKLLYYKTPHRNVWNIILCNHAGDVWQIYYVRTADKHGDVLYLLTEGSEGHILNKFTSHFFERYNERLQLGLKRPSDIIKHFIDHNDQMQRGQSEQFDNGRTLLTYLIEGGMAVGWMNDYKHIGVIKTFIASEMFTGNQKAFATHLANEVRESFKSTMTDGQFKSIYEDD